MDYDEAREALGALVADFIRVGSARSERLFRPDEVDSVPHGKAVRVTFDYILDDGPYVAAEEF